MGRAGRSGEEGNCHLFLSNLDFLRLRSLGHAEALDTCQVHRLLEEVFLSDFCSSRKKSQGIVHPSGTYGILEIPELVAKLDAKEEVLETLLSYIEVG